MPNPNIFCDFKIPCKILKIEAGSAYKIPNAEIPVNVTFETTAGLAAQIASTLGTPITMTECTISEFKFDDMLYNIPYPEDMDGNPRPDSFEDVCDSVSKVCEAAPRQFANSILFKYFHDYYLTDLNPKNRKIIEDILVDLADVTRRLNEDANDTAASTDEDAEPAVVSKSKAHHMQRYPKPPTIDMLEESSYAYAILASYMGPLRSMLSVKSKFEYDKITKQYTRCYDAISQSMSPLLNASGKTYHVSCQTTSGRLQKLGVHFHSTSDAYTNANTDVIEEIAFPKNAAKFIFVEAINECLSTIGIQ